MSVSKIVAAAASSAGGAGLDVDEVFSTFLYDGTGSAQTITNGIDLTEGGLVWTKSRSDGYGHRLVDTVNGVGKYLRSESTAALKTDSYAQEGVTAFNSNGYSLGNWANEDGFHRSGSEYVSFTFRKAPKFFDVVTYTGDGTNNRQIAHSLGCQFGMLIVKCTSHTNQWIVWHRSTGNGKYLVLNETNAQDSDLYNFFGSDNTTNGSTHFSVSSNTRANESGKTYVAYLFAHNNNDGEFGPDSDQDIIKCGSAPASAATDVNLGFEPQWIMIKRTDSSGDWQLYDTMRGLTAINGPDDRRLKANTSDAEAGSGSSDFLYPTPTGFHINTNFFGGGPYIYMAIRRGPLAAPDDATKVFFVDSGTAANNVLSTGFNPDMSIVGRTTGGSKYVGARLTGSSKYLFTDSTAAEASYPGWTWDESNQFKQGMYNANNVSWTWKRAPSYFDVCCYSGTGSARTVAHNLGVVPEMMWVKGRDSTDNWSVYHKDLNVGSGQYLQLNVDSSAVTNSNQFTTTAPTASVFSVGSDGAVNGSGSTYIAYLFTTLAGVSKVGSYDGNGSNQNIDCGFSSGARFILIKSKQSGSWFVFDTVRGIVAGNDSHLKLDSTNAEAYADSIDTYSGGFNVVQNSTTDLNKGPSDESYIFYAIA